MRETDETGIDRESKHSETKRNNGIGKRKWTEMNETGMAHERKQIEVKENE